MDLNKLYCGDNLEIMKTFPSESVDLIYMDPPYFTQRDWGEFDDRFDDIQAYLHLLKPRLEKCYDILKDTGSIYVHLDHHAVHYIAILMDEIFTKNNFRNEVIWHYASGGVSKNRLARKHDNILVYGKGENTTFNIQRVPYRSINISVQREGFHPDGKMMDDVWNISMMSSTSNERLGYPTQKSEALLERVIKISSNTGDVVFDPFCGSGTTCVVAKKLGRQYIGIDQNENAIKIAQDRLDEIINQERLHKWK